MGQRLSVAVGPADGGGRDEAYGDEATYAGASVVKAGILAALLLGAQDAGRELGGAERELAEPMIVRSDNDAASVLWARIGGARGFDAACARLGLRATAGGADGFWGLTRTTAGDQLALLRAVFGPGGTVLEARSRAYAQELMGRVVAGQDWGVSAAGFPYALKNGWMPRSGTGLWVVHSVGRVRTPGGRELLLAILSDGHPTLADGIAAVEAAARRSAGGSV
ncbi:serine hydrolase [Streptomyces monticola]|uniref:Serine hydrolase n=1 Tax=Streptomyces monticola TaxID=2666263 RepID=A0ABW2JQE9_9ACTN